MADRATTDAAIIRGLANGRSLERFTRVRHLPTGPRAHRACLTNATHVAAQRGLHVAVGTAIPAHAATKLGPVDHAWCVDSNGVAYEVTWPAAGHDYIGVIIGPPGQFGMNRAARRRRA